MRLTKIERQTYSRETLEREPCAEFESAQIPQQSNSVCVNCGYFRSRHGLCQCARGVTTPEGCIDRLRDTGKHQRTANL